MTLLKEWAKEMIEAHWAMRSASGEDPSQKDLRRVVVVSHPMREKGMPYLDVTTNNQAMPIAAIEYHHLSECKCNNCSFLKGV